MTDPTLVALGRDMEALKRRLDKLTTALQEAKNDAATAKSSAGAATKAVEQATRVLGDIVDRVEEIGQKRAIVDQDGEEEVEPFMPSWFRLDVEGALDAGTAIRRLIEWLDAVYLQYPGGRESLGECWLWHPWAIEELLALRAAWFDAVAGRSGPSSRLWMDWHSTHRPGVVRRLEMLLKSCSIDAHKPGGRAAQAPATVPGVLADAADQIAEWWISPGRSPVPPPPSPDVLAGARAAS